MPIWSNIDITQSDYNFMLGHRSPDDNGRDEDEIRSNGYFCAKATLQQPGEALRVLHAGTYKLPQGSDHRSAPPRCRRWDGEVGEAAMSAVALRD